MTHWTDDTESDNTTGPWARMAPIGDGSGGIDFIIRATDPPSVFARSDRPISAVDPSTVTSSGYKGERKP